MLNDILFYLMLVILLVVGLLIFKYAGGGKK